jgi:hypothetical protein
MTGITVRVLDLLLGQGCLILASIDVLGLWGSLDKQPHNCSSVKRVRIPKWLSVHVPA